MIGRAGGADLVRRGAVEQHRVAAVSAHHVIHEGLDVPRRAGRRSAPLVGSDEGEALGEPVVRPGQQVEGEHGRPCRVVAGGVLERTVEEAVAGGNAALNRIGVAV